MTSEWVNYVFRRLEIIQFRLTEKLMLTIPTGAPSFTDYLQPCVCTKVVLEQSVLTTVNVGL